MPEGSAALGRKGQFPRAIRPKKECIKSCETCFAKNVLSFLVRVQTWNEFVSPKFYGPLTIWPWLRISPRSSLYVIYCLVLTAWQWLMSFTYIPVQIEPNKSLSRQGSGPLLLREWTRCSEELSPWRSGHAHLNLSHLNHNAVDTACRWPCHFSFLGTL